MVPVRAGHAAPPGLGLVLAVACYRHVAPLGLACSSNAPDQRPGAADPMLVPRLLSFGILLRSSSIANLPAGTRTNASQLMKMTIGRMMLIALPNNQGERREAAATDARLVSELNGCLPFARPCGLGEFISFFAATVTL